MFSFSEKEEYHVYVCKMPEKNGNLEIVCPSSRLEIFFLIKNTQTKKQKKKDLCVCVFFSGVLFTQGTGPFVVPSKSMILTELYVFLMTKIPTFISLDTPGSLQTEQPHRHLLTISKCS